MIDLHTHTLFSDGVLVPSELIRRAVVKGVGVIALSDHADMSNIDFILPRIVRACEANTAHRDIVALPAVEITHVPPALIAGLTVQARELGAKLVVMHGESPVEPVEPGTNRAAIEAGVDILAHPGWLTEEDAVLAADSGVFLEITARRGHNQTNAHVAALAEKVGAKLALNTDAHAPGDLIDEDEAREIALAAGLSIERYALIQKDMLRLAGLGEDR
jgi:histidinol phosphatase-like PHP family hydrolase